MAIDINGYNATFDAFVKFAETQQAAGKQKAVARLETADANELGGIVNRTIKPGSGDWVGVGQGRLASLKRANNITRDAFRKAVADMFGSENHIPESVRDAMKMQDYDKGKPLTARRILAVKAAIDAEIKLGKFDSMDAEGAAKGKGWTAAELPKVARAAHFLSAVTGEDELASIERLSTPGSKENRLLNYGGRFLDSLSGFKDGLRLIDTFNEWFTDVGNALKNNGDVRREGMNRTLLNASYHNFTPQMLRGTEKFVFETIAHDPSFNLAETDANRLFGMENNVATHFFGRELNQACTQTIAQIPPEKRKTFFTAVTMFFPVVDNAEDASKKGKARGEPSSGKFIVARVLKNLDKIAALEANGTLTFKNLARVVATELPADSSFEFREVGAALSKVTDDVCQTLIARNLDFGNLLGPVINILQETGCSMEEAIEAATGGRQQPLAPYMSSGTLGLEAFDGTTQRGRERLESDLVRPRGYGDLKTGKDYLPPEKVAFTFNFPDEKPIATNSTEQGRKNTGTVMDKIEALCGKTRPSQASSVMTMVSQSALSILRGGLSIYGIDANEHNACDFMLARDAETGDVTIRYSSPRELPFSFEWTATVKLDGYVSTTPFRFMSEETRRNAEIVGPKALAAGYHKSEIPMLANAFGLVKSATGCSEAEALEKTLDPQSRERRLFGYGGRLIASTENFKRGLALMDKFVGWYRNVVDEVNKNRNNLGDVPDPTVRNADWGYLGANTETAYEKFLFEEIAANDSLPLGADNLDEVFGMEANAAMRFVGRGYTASLNDTVARMPVEIRQVLFAAFDVMQPLAKDAAELRDNSLSAVPGGTSIPVARVMRHLDALREMQKAGSFTAENVKVLLFPDVQGAGTKSLKVIVDEIQQRAIANYSRDGAALMRIYSMMEASGCSYDEAVAADSEGRVLPHAPYILSGTGKLEDLDGTARGARKQAVGDLVRPSNPISVQTKARILQRQSQVFTVRFPDGVVLMSGISNNNAENEGPANAIADKATEFVGEKHQAQLASVMIGLTQSAHGPFLENAAKLGFVRNNEAEHSAITYTFSRNDETGAVTIRYSEPQGFPKKFHWETTIALDGSAVTSPLSVDE